MVCADGAEIGRAQYLQALASRCEPNSAMNPVLLKPGSDRRSFIVLRGKPAGTLESGQYAHGRRHLAEAAWEAYRELADSHQIVICEGAGSPAEINLRDGDYVNMGLARHFNLPTIIVGDIDRGGVLASLYGTWALLDDEDRALLRGYIINKFRGDDQILTPGLDKITSLTAMKHLGTVPWLRGVWLDGEDTLEVGRWRHDHVEQSDTSQLNVAVVRLPRISNATDVDALAAEANVSVHVTTDPKTCAQADLLVLPGSRSTISDLEWLRAQGIADVIVQRATQSRPVLGICGGYQMLGHRIVDGIESADQAEGLKLLPIDVTFRPEKITTRSQASWRGIEASGYEIHHGICTPNAQADEAFLDGVMSGSVAGTMMHGSLESDEFRRAYLDYVAKTIGSDWRTDPQAATMNDHREAMIESLAHACEEHLDIDAMIEMAYHAQS